MICPENEISFLNELPVGARLIVQCRKDWRTAVVSTVGAEKVVLIILSPTGRTYRKSFAGATAIEFEGAIPVLGEGLWRENLANYDIRW